METIANKCNIIKNVENSQTNSEINASVVGENILKAAFPQITGFIIEDYTISPLEVKLVLRSTASHAFCDRCGRLTFHTRGWQKKDCDHASSGEQAICAGIVYAPFLL